MGERTGLGCGGLFGTVRAERAVVLAALAPLGEYLERDRALQWYERSAALGQHGALIGWQPKGQATGRENEIYFEIKQRACDALGIDQVAEIARKLGALGAHFTRSDIYFDDRQRRAEVAQVRDAFEAGERVTHLREWDEIRNSKGGHTLYLGKRGQSEQVLRIYDKDREQGAEIGTHGVRWELQARDDKAGYLVGYVLLAEPAARGARLAAVLAGVVDFRARVGMRNGDRAGRLAWWALLVGDVERARSAVVQVVDSLVRRVKWLRDQVAPTLALTYLAAGGDVDFLQGLASMGLRRLKERDVFLLPRELRPAWYGGAAAI